MRVLETLSELRMRKGAILIPRRGVGISRLEVGIPRLGVGIPTLGGDPVYSTRHGRQRGLIVSKVQGGKVDYFTPLLFKRHIPLNMRMRSNKAYETDT